MESHFKDFSNAYLQSASMWTIHQLKSPQNSKHTKDLTVLETKQRPGACLACYPNNLFIKLEIQGK